MGTPLALVPVRSPGKSRLAAYLNFQQRHLLVAAMLGDVADALRDAGLRRLVAVVDGERASSAARRAGLEALPQPAGVSDLNAALRAAIHALRPADVLIVPADLPGLVGADVRAVLDPRADVVVAPSRDGGTSALRLTPGDAIPLRFGPGSGYRHVRLARRTGHEVRIVRRMGFAQDVDRPVDLVHAAPSTFGPRTRDALKILGVVPGSAGVGQLTTDGLATS